MEVRTPTDYENIKNQPAGTNVIFMDDVDYGGGELPRQLWTNDITVDFNGYKVHNFSSIEFSPAIKDINAICNDIWLDGTFTRSSGSCGALSFDAGYSFGVRIDGLIRSNDNIATAIEGIRYDGDEVNCLKDVIINADMEGFTGVEILGSTTATQSFFRSVFTGTASILSGGSGPIQYFGSGVDPSRDHENHFWDVTKNPTMVKGGGNRVHAHPKSTGELQTLAAYMDFSEPYVGSVADGTVSATSGGNTLIGTNTNFSLMSPGERLRIGNDANREVVTIDTVISTTEITISGTFVNSHSAEAFFEYDREPIRNFDMADIASYVDEPLAIDDGISYPILGASVAPPQFVSGTVTLSGVATPDAVVGILRAKNPFSDTGQLVETVQADAQGVWTSTIERDGEYFYWGEPRVFIVQFTGNLSGGVSGSVLTTSNDLTNISIGGPNDDLWMFVAKAGTGAGQEVAIKSRSNNDIDVGISGLFDTTTEYEIGKAYFAGDVFPKDTVV